MKTLLKGCLALTFILATSNTFAFNFFGSTEQPWGGIFFGANLGYGWSDQSVTETGSTLFGTGSIQSAINRGAIPGTLASNSSGALGGFEANYNYGVNKYLVVGVAADYDWANIYDAQTVTTNVTPFANFATSSQQNLQSLGSVRLLVGLTPPSYLLLGYLTGGFGYGNVSLNGSITNPSCVFFCGNTKTSGMNSGWTVGAGLAYALGASWAGKFEYLYYDLANQSLVMNDGRFPGISLTQSIAYKGNVVRFGIDYKLA